MAEQLHVQLRETRGKRNARRLRKAGSIPAVLYGHGEETVSLAVPTDEIDAALRHGSRVVNLTGPLEQQAFIRELQWDTWGTHVLHVDFTRVDAEESVQVRVPLELRGEAPGLKAGGVIEQTIHEIEVECPAGAIPDKLTVNVNRLNLGESITISQLRVAAGARVLDDPETVVVQCVQPLVVEEEEEGLPSEVEPEVIGRKKEEEGESEGT